MVWEKHYLSIMTTWRLEPWLATDYEFVDDNNCKNNSCVTE